MSRRHCPNHRRLGRCRGCLPTSAVACLLVPMAVPIEILPADRPRPRPDTAAATGRPLSAALAGFSPTRRWYGLANSVSPREGVWLHGRPHPSRLPCSGELGVDKYSDVAATCVAASSLPLAYSTHVLLIICRCIDAIASVRNLLFCVFYAAKSERAGTVIARR